MAAFFSVTAMGFMVLSRILISLSLAVLLVTSAAAFLPEYEALRAGIQKKYTDLRPQQWGERVAGVRTRIATREKKIALTLDACGGGKGLAIDARLLEFLEKEQIPATLFVNARWIDGNLRYFERLAANPLFEIANHGFHHKPASATGRTAYGIGGTGSVRELVDEIGLNALKIEQVTGRKPRFYRSGTAYYDEVAVMVARELGQEVAGYSLLGDAGATYTADQVKHALLQAAPGDIVILHMNHPESGTASGVMEAVPLLRKSGFTFVRLSDELLQ